MAEQPKQHNRLHKNSGNPAPRRSSEQQQNQRQNLGKNQGPNQRRHTAGAQRTTRGQDRRNAAGRQRNRGGERPRQYSAQKPTERARQASPSRVCAYEVLQAVATEDAYANLLLPHKIREHRLNKADAAFATELCYGALRLAGSYDAILSLCVDRPIKRLDPQVLDVLRLGCHQLLNMRVPSHAALNESVALTREKIGAGAAGLVNAVLRKITAQDYAQWITEACAGTTDQISEYSIRYSHPEWIIRALKQALRINGQPAEALSASLQANNEAPELHLVALPGIGNLAPVLQAGAEPLAIAPDAASFRGGDAARLPGVSEGTVRVQDVASQLIARALAAAPLSGTTPAAHEEHWADLCAGPGGKAALLAALAAEQGAHLLANEVTAHRVELVRQALAPIPDNHYTLRHGDGRTIDQASPAGGFQRILLDAPCTGLGALRRRPEARWRKQLSDLAELTPLQAELLTAGYQVLAPGGVLAYITCSPHTSESYIQIKDFLAAHPEVELLDAREILNQISGEELFAPANQGKEGSVKDQVVGRCAQFWPQLHHSDAMFMALLRKPATASAQADHPQNPA